MATNDRAGIVQAAQPFRHNRRFRLIFTAVKTKLYVTLSTRSCTMVLSQLMSDAEDLFVVDLVLKANIHKLV